MTLLTAGDSTLWTILLTLLIVLLAVGIQQTAIRQDLGALVPAFSFL